MFVGQNENASILQIIVHQQIEELHFARHHLALVSGVDHVDDCLRLLVVHIPETPQVFLAANVPDLQLDIRVTDFFYIGANRRLSDHHLAQSQLVENGSLAAIGHPHYDYFDWFVLLTGQPFPYF